MTLPPRDRLRRLAPLAALIVPLLVIAALVAEGGIDLGKLGVAPWAARR